MGRFNLCSCLAVTPTADDEAVATNKAKKKQTVKPTALAAVAPDAGAAPVAAAPDEGAVPAATNTAAAGSEMTRKVEPIVLCPPGEDNAMNYTRLLRPAYRMTAKEAYAALRRNRSARR